MAIFGGYDEWKLKSRLKMAVTRLQKLALRNSFKQQRCEIAKLLGETPPKREEARIKAEALIRDEDTIEAYEILRLYCDLLSKRIRLISQRKSCPPELVECVSTMIWASAVVDVPELVEVRKQFRFKYGRKFEKDAMRNAGGVVNKRVEGKLSIEPLSADLVQDYLEKIANEHGVRLPPNPNPPPVVVDEDRLPTSPFSLPDDIEEEDVFVPGGWKKSNVTPPRAGGIFKTSFDRNQEKQQCKSSTTTPPATPPATPPKRTQTTTQLEPSSSTNSEFKALQDVPLPDINTGNDMTTSEYEEPLANLPDDQGLKPCPVVMLNEEFRVPPRDWGMPVEPKDDDVLLGKGWFTNTHPGNTKFRDKALELRSWYEQSDKEQKFAITKVLLESVTENGNRFVEKGDDGLWHEVNKEDARYKASQALREKRRR
ncbi:hypothetical protein ACHAW5_011052 [Stephanodiscus triporus]|uniref:DUF6824 domain-containing protein n=1 Tax=Stephanodiscus triporus TaxID=2934178 RepID=A0ABD3NKI4_9STRA